MRNQQLAGAAGTLLEGTHGVQYDFQTSADDQPAWRVRRWSLQERISAPYRLQVELGADALKGSPMAMLGKHVSLRWQRRGTHALHGIVESVREGERSSQLAVVCLTVVPALEALRHTVRSRIFSEMRIPEVVREVLEGPLGAFGRKLKHDLARSSYPKREYVVQYRESDLAFVQRLLAEQGLWYYFDQSGDVETLVITDAVDKAPLVDDKHPEVELSSPGAGASAEERITGFALRETVRTSAVSVRQYNWTKPDAYDEAHCEVSDPSGLALPAYEHGDVAEYDYQEPRYRANDADAQAKLRWERYQQQRATISGTSEATLLRAGHLVKVAGEEYLITHVIHGGDTTLNTFQASREGTYQNVFECISREHPFRPPLPEKPRIHSVQTATVVDRAGQSVMPASSGEGEDIVTDKHGRIRVKFHWDLTPHGQGGATSCWLRCAQSWAGRQYGFQFVPRVGMEVVVQFIDGDPDQPLVTGCVYNGLNPPPYADRPTQSGIKTASSVDRSRYNELRFEDAKDNEQIFVRAQRDYVEEVLNDHKTTVAGAQMQTVKKSQTESIQGDQSLSVGGKRSKTVGGDGEHGEEITIRGERKTTVTGKNSELFGDEHERDVTKAVRESYRDSHERTVAGVQTFKAESDKIENVAGRYELTTGAAYVLNQGGTKLTLEGDGVVLDAASDISVVQGGSSIDVDTGGNIALKATGSITLEVGPNKLTISASGIELKGMQIAATAGPSELALTPASAGLKSVNTQIEATAICAVKGAMVNLN